MKKKRIKPVLAATVDPDITMLMLAAIVFQLAINEESARRSAHRVQMEAAMCKIILGTAHGIEVQAPPTPKK